LLKKPKRRKKMSEKPLDLEENNIKKMVKKDLSIKVFADVDRAISLTINEIKQRIKKACEFYLKYRNNPNLLYDDFSINMEYDEPINKLREKIEREFNYLSDMNVFRIYIEKYNEWLLKEAFKPVFEEVKENVKEND